MRVWEQNRGRDGAMFTHKLVLARRSLSADPLSRFATVHFLDRQATDTQTRSAPNTETPLNNWSAFEMWRLQSAAFEILALLEFGCSTPSGGGVQAKYSAFKLLATFGIHVPSKSDAFEVQLIIVSELKVALFWSSTPSGGGSLYIVTA